MNACIGIRSYGLPTSRRHRKFAAVVRPYHFECDTVLPPLTRTPTVLAEFLQSTTGWERIPGLTTVSLSFTSLGANIGHLMASNRVSAYCFRIHDSNYYNIGGHLPTNKVDTPFFSLGYVYDARNGACQPAC
jgi:hypothetical protein